MTNDFFRSRADWMIDAHYPLAVLVNHLPWQEIEASLAQRWARKVNAYKKIEGQDLCSLASVVTESGVSKADRSRVPTRLIVALLRLNHAFNKTDEDVIQNWGETPIRQYFSGNEHFVRSWSRDPTQLGRFRTLLEATRTKVLEGGQANSITLKQTYAREGKDLHLKAGRYAHARQLRRLRKFIKRQRTIVVRTQREIERKMTAVGQTAQESQGRNLDKAKCLVAQAGNRNAADNGSKLFSWHAPEAESTLKGKCRIRYEFGMKVSPTMMRKGNLIVGVGRFPANPHGAHTLHEQIKQTTVLMQSLGVNPEKVYIDLGLMGADKENPDIEIKHLCKDKRLTVEARRLLKRRKAVEPIIGHVKSDHREDRCLLNGSEGDALHAVLCPAGYNIGGLLRIIATKDLSLLLRTQQAAGLLAVWQKLAALIDHIQPKIQIRIM